MLHKGKRRHLCPHFTSAPVLYLSDSTERSIVLNLSSGVTLAILKNKRSQDRPRPRQRQLSIMPRLHPWSRSDGPRRRPSKPLHGVRNQSFSAALCRTEIITTQTAVWPGRAAWLCVPLTSLPSPLPLSPLPCSLTPCPNSFFILAWR